MVAAAIYAYVAASDATDTIVTGAAISAVVVATSDTFGDDNDKEYRNYDNNHHFGDDHDNYEHNEDGENGFASPKETP